MRKNLLSLILVITLFPACTPSPPPTPTPNINRVPTTNEMHSLYFEPTDLDDGWLTSTYEIYDYDGVFTSENIISAKTVFISAVLPTTGRRGVELRGSQYATQDVLKYSSSEDAREMLETMRLFNPDYKPGNSLITLDKTLEANSMNVCRSSADPPSYSCRLTIHYEEYSIQAFMYIDGDKITLSDWHDLVYAIQDNILALEASQ